MSVVNCLSSLAAGIEKPALLVIGSLQCQKMLQDCCMLPKCAEANLHVQASGVLHGKAVMLATHKIAVPDVQ